MTYTIWRVSPGGQSFQLTTSGASSLKEKAVEKARLFNDRLRQSDPDSDDRFVVRDERGREYQVEDLKRPA